MKSNVSAESSACATSHELATPQSSNSKAAQGLSPGVTHSRRLAPIPHSNSTFRTPHSALQSAFTLIEITICLAVIGFALVAIIGILPLGLNTQKENRQETIVKQDADVFMNAIRNGEQGLDDLTNYVMAITNYYTIYWGPRRPKPATGVEYYTPKAAWTPGFFLTNGYRIIGLLSTPKYVPLPQDQYPGGFRSNHVVGFVRSISGPASEKFPQTDPGVRDLGLNYRLVPEVLPYGTNFYDVSWTNFGAFATNSVDYANRQAYYNLVKGYEGTLHDLRLIFRWPLLPNGDAGNDQQIFRTLVGGRLINTNEFPWTNLNLYFFQPRYYR